MEIFGLGAPELILILIILLLFFGKDKLPNLARSIGQSFRELKSGFNGSDASTETKDKKDASGTTRKL